MFGPQFGYMLHSQIKRRTNDTAGHAGNHGQYQPFQQLFAQNHTRPAQDTILSLMFSIR